MILKTESRGSSIYIHSSLSKKFNIKSKPMNGTILRWKSIVRRSRIYIFGNLSKGAWSLPDRQLSQFYPCWSNPISSLGGRFYAPLLRFPKIHILDLLKMLFHPEKVIPSIFINNPGGDEYSIIWHLSDFGKTKNSQWYTIRSFLFSLGKTKSSGCRSP